MAIRAIVFDFDGVILDTETPLYDSWQEIFIRYNAHLDLELWSSYIGGGGEFDVHGHLEEQIGSPLSRPDLMEERRTKYRERVSANPVLPGVVEYLMAASDAMLSVGLASSSDLNWVRSNLVQRGLIHHFQVLKTRDDVEKVKPDPALYSEAVEALETEPHEAIAIEDSAKGVRAAKAAGLFTVAVPNPVTRHLPFEGADLVVDSLSDLPFNRLIELASDD